MIWVYGDSFVEDHHYSWTRILARMRGHKVKNFAKGGTSIEWSALQFVKGQFKDGDIVIFVLSNASRFDVEPFMTHTPALAYSAKNYDSLDAHQQWYVEHRSTELLDFKPSLYASLVYAVSQNFPGVKFLVMCGFDDSCNSSVVKKSKNFLILDNLSLNTISHYEVNEWKLNPYMLYNVTGHDPRVNHLSSVNLRRLAWCVDNVISFWDRDMFKLNAFSKNVINKHVSNMDELQREYIDTGICYADWVEKTKIPVTNIQGSLWHRLKDKVAEFFK